MATRETNRTDRGSTGAQSSSGTRGTSVRDVMTPNPECVTETSSIHEAARLMVKCDCGAIPVIGPDKKVVGMITDRDIVVRIVAKGTEAGNARVADAMTKGVHTVREDDSLESVHRMMSQKQIRRVPVVGADDKVVGIVALADLATETRGDQESKIAHTVEEISETGREHKQR